MTGPALAQSYDVTDFDALNNPTGVWSYGYVSSLGGAFNLLPDHLANYYGLENWLQSDQAPFYPAVVHNASALPNVNWAMNPLPPDAVGLHPANADQWGVVRFTSPADAWYDLGTLFDGLGGATVDVHVYYNGTDPLFAAELNQNNAGNTAGFMSTLFIGQGETLDFLVGHGNNLGNLSHHNDGTQLSGLLRVRPDLGNQRTPEPGTLAMLVGAGIAASLVVVRRRRA